MHRKFASLTERPRFGAVLTAIAELAGQDSQKEVRFAGLGDAELASGKNDRDGKEEEPARPSSEA